MRIVGGKYKRTPLQTLEGNEITRPTKDMVREALFSSILVHNETVFLDLFAGSGAIGIEALSRGAQDVVFNDSNRDAVRIIRANLNKVKEDRLVLNLDYQDCLRSLKGRTFDAIYVDPPYRFDAYEEIFRFVDEYSLLQKRGLLIIEVHKDTVLKENYDDIALFKERRYGINKLLYYRKEN